jgi:hypothetical protein
MKNELTKITPSEKKKKKKKKRTDAGKKEPWVSDGDVDGRIAIIENNTSHNEKVWKGFDESSENVGLFGFLDMSDDGKDAFVFEEKRKTQRKKKET